MKFILFYCKNVTTTSSVKVSRAHRPDSLSDLMQSEVTDLVWLITALFPQRCACEAQLLSSPSQREQKPASSRLQTGLSKSREEVKYCVTGRGHYITTRLTLSISSRRYITRHTASCTCATSTRSWIRLVSFSAQRRKKKKRCFLSFGLFYIYKNVIYWTN